jgi:peptide deformylase
MAILKVARMGHPVLREPAQAIAQSALKKPELLGLVEDMVHTMADYVGVGLAAPQVHYGVRLFLIQPDPGDEATLRVAVNPTITPLTEETEEGWEGCLSIPDIHGMVPRHMRVRLEAFDAEGKKYAEELEGFAARVAQHEADHLDGVLFMDRMTNLSTLAFGDEFRRYHAPRPEPEDERDRVE